MKDAEKLKKSVFYAHESTIEKFKHHCEAQGITLWRGFMDAVNLWVSSTQDARIIEPGGEAWK